MPDCIRAADRILPDRHADLDPPPTVLVFLFVLTKVPTEAVALKLFTGLERFEIMAIPFFILAGSFLTHGGVARRMIRLPPAWSALVRRAGSGRRARVRIVRRRIGSITSAMVRAGFPNRFGAGGLVPQARSAS